MSRSTDFPPNSSIIRRADVHLRVRYPHLETRIFEVEPHVFAIVFPREQMDASVIDSEFQNSIRQIGHPVSLSNETPSHFLREIPMIADDQVASRMEGFGLTFTDIRNILLSKYPDLPEPRGVNNRIDPITIIFSEPLSTLQEANVRGFMQGHLPGWPFAIEIDPLVQAAVSPPNRPGETNIDVTPSRLRPKAPKYVQGDEAFWYENIEGIFSGGMLATSIQPIDEVGVACYIEGAGMEAIDLRQALLLYDTIYLSPPVEDRTSTGPSFWENQKLTKEDVLRLVELGRVRLLTLQPEERLDTNFLEAAHERNSTAVIGRLTAAAVMAADIVQTAQEYRLAAPELRPTVSALIAQIAEETKSSPGLISRLLLWPLHAQRCCLEPLRTRGLMGIDSFGLGDVLGSELKAVTKKDVALEALFTSNGVHVAHAFRATLIPPVKEMRGWIRPRRLVGDRLNFYRNFNGRVAASWATNERRKERRQTLIPPLPLFEFHKRAKLEDLIEVTSRGSSRRKARALFTRLTELEPTERAAEIERLSQELYDLGARRTRRSAIVDNASDVADVGSALLDISIFPLRPMWNLLRGVLQLARRKAGFDRFIDIIEADISEQFGRNSDIDILSKIERVAHLHEDTSAPMP